MARLDDIKARLSNLRILREDELKSKKLSKLYIEDLDLSIKFCEDDLRHLGKPLDIINGVS